MHDTDVYALLRIYTYEWLLERFVTPPPSSFFFLIFSSVIWDWVAQQFVPYILKDIWRLRGQMFRCSIFFFFFTWDTILNAWISS